MDKEQRACHNCIDLEFHEPINFIRCWTVKKFTFPIKQSKYEKSQKNITLKIDDEKPFFVLDGKRIQKER